MNKQKRGTKYIQKKVKKLRIKKDHCVLLAIEYNKLGIQVLFCDAKQA